MMRTGSYTYMRITYFQDANIRIYVGHYLHKKAETNFLKLTVCSYFVTYAFQSESTLCSCMNVKELLAQSRGKI